MAIEIFLKLDGIDGESVRPGAEKWIEIFSFSNGASNPSSVAFGSGSGGGKVDLSSLSLQKQLDISSPKLFLHTCNGAHIATGQMIVREAMGSDSASTYFQYDMTEVFIDSISWTGSVEGGRPSESISLSAKSLQVTYFPQSSDGSLGSKVVSGWDVSKNQKL